MKINQIIVENKKVDEAPVGALTQMGRKLGSRVLNKVGAKATAQNMAGKADLGATANKLYQQYNNYLGTQNKSIKQATGADLKNFLATKNVKVNVPNGPIDPARLDKMFLKVARDAMAKKTRPASSSAQGQGQPAAGNTAPPPAQGQGSSSSAYAQTKATALKLSAKEKRRLIQQLTKSLAKPATPNFKSRRTPPTP